MRSALALCSALMIPLVAAAPCAARADTEITTCGQELAGGAAHLSADLDCAGASYGVRFYGSGAVDLRGFTIRNASVAIACDGSCNVRNGSLIDNLTGVGGARVKLTDVTIAAEQSGINFGVIGEKGATLKRVTIDGAFDAAVAGNRGSIKLDTVTIAAGRHGVRTEGTITALDTTVTGASRAGLAGTRVKLVRSSVTGSGSDPDCNTLMGFQFFLCADVLSWKQPAARASTCDTSMVLSSNINLANPADWDVCTLD